MTDTSKKQKSGHIFSARLPVALGSKIDDTQRKLQERAPFATVTTSDAIRVLVECGVEAFDRDKA